MIAGAAGPLLGKTARAPWVARQRQLVAAAVIAVVAAAFQLVTHKDHEQRIVEGRGEGDKKPARRMRRSAPSASLRVTAVRSLRWLPLR
jgi:hypothetical protein